MHLLKDPDVESNPDAAHSAMWREKQIVVARRVIPAMFATRHFAFPWPKIAIGIASMIMWRQLDVLIKAVTGGVSGGVKMFLKIACSFLAALGPRKL